MVAVTAPSPGTVNCAVIPAVNSAASDSDTTTRTCKLAPDTCMIGPSIASPTSISTSSTRRGRLVRYTISPFGNGVATAASASASAFRAASSAS